MPNRLLRELFSSPTQGFLSGISSPNMTCVYFASPTQCWVISFCPAKAKTELFVNLLYVHNKNLYITDTTWWVFLFLVFGFAMLWIEARVLYMPDTCSVTDRIVTGRKQGAGERQCEGACGLRLPLITGAAWAGGVVYCARIPKGLQHSKVAMQPSTQNDLHVVCLVFFPTLNSP